MFDKELISFTMRDFLKGVSIIIALIIFIFLLCIIPWSHTNTPAWVQAVGSVLAIIVAIFVVHYQSILQRKLERNKNKEFVKKLSITLNNIATDAQRAGEPQDDSLTLMNENILEGLVYANNIVQAIQPISIPSVELMSKWLSMVIILKALEEDLKIYISLPPDVQNGIICKKSVKKHALSANSKKFRDIRLEFGKMVDEYSG